MLTSADELRELGEEASANVWDIINTQKQGNPDVPKMTVVSDADLQRMAEEKAAAKRRTLIGSLVIVGILGYMALR